MASSDTKQPVQTRLPKWLHWTGLQGKTLWDFFQLLVIPFALAVFGNWFSEIQKAREFDIEATRQAAQSTVEANRANDNILQSYLDDMSTLMLREEFAAVPRGTCHLFRADQSQENRAPITLLAHSRSLVVRSQLDGERLSAVVRFLIESKLLGLIDCNLESVNLTQADLSHFDLRDAVLSAANLSEADLSDAILGRANLRFADLSDANLNEADLFHANLFGAGLSNANLRFAFLGDANLGRANLSGANLRFADLRAANLGDADLTGADLTGARFDENTVLPDSNHWTPDSNLTAFGAIVEDITSLQPPTPTPSP